MIKDDRPYFRNRAEEELAIALDSSDSASAEIHRNLAKLYFAKAADPKLTDDTKNLWSTP